jgi:hypothetical protein
MGVPAGGRLAFGVRRSAFVLVLVLVLEFGVGWRGVGVVRQVRIAAAWRVGGAEKASDLAVARCNSESALKVESQHNQQEQPLSRTTTTRTRTILKRRVRAHWLASTARAKAPGLFCFATSWH